MYSQKYFKEPNHLLISKDLKLCCIEIKSFSIFVYIIEGQRLTRLKKLTLDRFSLSSVLALVLTGEQT